MVCEARDAAVMGGGEGGHCDKIGHQWELNSLHSLETGLCMLGIEKCDKGEQVNWWVSVQACSSKNPTYSLLS